MAELQASLNRKNDIVKSLGIVIREKEKDVLNLVEIVQKYDNAVEEEKARFEIIKEALEEEDKSLQSRMGFLLRETMSTEKTIRQLEASNQNLQQNEAQVENVIGERTSLKLKFSSIIAENRSLANRLATLKEDNLQLQVKNQELEASLVRLDARVLDLNIEVEDMGYRLARNFRETSQLEQELESKTLQLKDME